MIGGSSVRIVFGRTLGLVSRYLEVVVRFILFVVALLCSVSVAAQDRSRAILVLDGSGSMWGQIDGVAKIEIAQDVVGSLLGEITGAQELGLTVYGHRRKGDCSDIETIVEPGPSTLGAIESAVNAVSPRGKTPMTDAVIAAAEALKYTEEKATVILVSDGIETCAPDPCAAARALEEAGVDFTAHVVGFDISDNDEAVAQMQCIADETGGTFRTASSAAELGDALVAVTDPDPTYSVKLIATEGEGGPRILEGLAWDIGQTENGPWLAQSSDEDSPFFGQLPGGSLYARVTRSEDGATADQDFVIDENTPGTLVLVLPERPPEPVKLTARAYLATGGQHITEGLLWTLTNADGERLLNNIASATVVEELLPGTYQVEVVRIEDEEFDEASVVIEKGDNNKVIRLELPEIPRPAKLTFDARIIGTGRLIRRELAWTITDRDGNTVYSETGDGDVLFTMPGRYTLSAIRNEDGVEISQEIALLKRGNSVTLEFPPYAPLATLDAPSEVPAGSNFLVDWTGPNEKNDYIAVAKVGAKDKSYDNYEYTRQGPTVELTMPSEPGEYEVRYFMANEGRIAARVPITAGAISATLLAPDQAASGATIPVEWTGPSYRNDYIDVSEVGAADNKYIHYQYTRHGSPAKVEMPIEPGVYQLRYVVSQGRVILATRQIEITPETFGVSGPVEGVAGAVIPVDWTGPNLANDYISIAKPGVPGSKYETYAYTRHGSPAKITLPMEPGDYEIRYVVSQGRQSMSAYTVTVSPVTGSIQAAETAPAGGQLEVQWDGPGYQKDYVAIAEVGSKINKYLSYRNTRDGKVLQVQVPSEPGTYELRYLANSSSRTLLASQPLTVTDVSASLQAPESVDAGTKVDVTWEGPGYRRDYVAIFPKGEPRKYLTYQNTRNGDVLSIKVPEEPGDYELRYIMGQDRRELFSVPLIVK